MEIIPISFDSMGTRSMATFIKTKDVNILIDPGVSLAPKRYGLPPHPREVEKMKEDWEQIVDFAHKSDILIITHYHYDHHNPWENLEIYEDKILLLKHPKDHINFSQKKRSWFFLKQIQGLPKEIIYADGKEFSFGDTKIKISNPVPHGPTTKLGWVIQVLVDDGKIKALFTSDVEGPVLEEQINFAIENKPNIVILDGPMTYMLGYRFSRKNYEKSLTNIERLLKDASVDKLVIDHHFLRDINWLERLGGLPREKIVTAAEFAGKQINLLEAKRKELWENEPG